MEHILLESIVGELQEDELTGRTDYGAIYDLYGKHIPPEWCALEHRASGGRKVAISCSALCSAAGLLPLAKALTHMSKVFVDLGRCASASAALGPACTDVPNALGMSLLVKLGDLKDRPGTLMESLRSARAVLALTKNPMAETFCKGCETRIPNLLTKMIQITCEEFDAIKAAPFIVLRSPHTWRPRGLSKSVISRIILRVTPCRVLITLLITHLLSPRGLQVVTHVCRSCLAHVSRRLAGHERHES